MANNGNYCSNWKQKCEFSRIQIQFQVLIFHFLFERQYFIHFITVYYKERFGFPQNIQIAYWIFVRLLFYIDKLCLYAFAFTFTFQSFFVYGIKIYIQIPQRCIVEQCFEQISGCGECVIISTSLNVFTPNMRYYLSLQSKITFLLVVCRSLERDYNSCSLCAIQL